MRQKFTFLVLAAMVLVLDTFGQTFVSTGILKYPLLEEGTGTWCSWCPEGTQVIHEQVKPSYPRTVCVAFHNNDTMMLAGDPFNRVYTSGFPTANVDRVRWAISYDTGTALGREHWRQAVDTQYNKIPNFRVDMFGLYDSVTRTISLKVTGKALATLTGQYRINAYIVEDSIPSVQTKFIQRSAYYDDIHSWYYNQCIGPCTVSTPHCINCSLLPDSVFKHEHVVRAILGNGGSIYGDSAFTDPAIGDTASRTYTYVVPAAYQWKYISVVGFITKYGSSVVYDAQVQNAIEAKIKLMWKTLSVNTVEDAITGVVLAPNPAMDYVCLSATIGQTSATSVVVTNSIGQEMFTQVYPAGRSTLSENIPLQNMPNGLYQVTIVNDGEKVTRKLTISR